MSEAFKAASFYDEYDSNSPDNRRLLPWIKGSDYTSTDKDNPDYLLIKVVDPEPIETKYSYAVHVLLHKGIDDLPRLLSVGSKEANYSKFMSMWLREKQRGRIREGTEMILKTHLRPSAKTPGRMVRDWEMLINNHDQQPTPSPPFPSEPVASPLPLSTPSINARRRKPNTKAVRSSRRK